MQISRFDARNIKEKTMKVKVGLWIDQRKAILITITEKGYETGIIISSVEKQLRRTGDSPLKGNYESQKVPADDSRQRALKGHMNAYYDAIIAYVGEANSILVFGPGEAKIELKKRLKKKSLEGRILVFETVDKMTDKQIAAKIHKQFSK
jgi:hypothetical protein